MELDWASGDVILADGVEVARAERSWFRERLAISRAGTVIGEARSSGMFTTRSRISLSEPVSTQVGCFLLWVSHVELGRRQSGAGAGAAT